MIDAIYAVIIVVFASLGVLSLFNHLVRGSELREQVTEMREQSEQIESRIVEVRTELDDLKFDSATMEDERVALERQARCLLDLEERYKSAQAAALEGEPKRRRGA